MAWDLHPDMIVLVAAGAVILLRGSKRRASAGRDRWCYTGMGVVVVAVLSPIARDADTVFTLHMTQHMLLMYVAPVLFALGHASTGFLLGLPASVRRFVLRLRRPINASSNVVLAGVACNIVLWFWHAPNAYQSVLHNAFLHGCEHVTLFASAYWLWSALLSKRLREPVVGLLVLFVTALSTSALGTLLTFSRQPWYPAYHGVAHLSALSDQQLGGVVMLAIGIPIHLAVFTYLFMRWLAVEETRANALVAAR